MPKQRSYEWISVNDRLPSTEECYLCVIKDDIRSSFIRICLFEDNKFRIKEWFTENLHRNVTHWMPLPEIPHSFASLEGSDYCPSFEKEVRNAGDIQGKA